MAGSHVRGFDWTVATSSFSDHEILIFRASAASESPPPIQWKTITNFPRLKEEISQRCIHVKATDEAETTAIILHEILSEAFRTCSRKVKPFKGPPLAQTILLGKAKRLKRRWRRNPSLENRKDLDRLLQELRSEPAQPLSQNLIRRFVKEGSAQINPTTGDPARIEDYFNTEEDPFTPYPFSQLLPSHEEFSKEEVRAAFLSKAQKQSAPSPLDGCSFKLLNEMATESSAFLDLCHSCFNLCWNQSCFPQIWKRAVCVFIPKKSGSPGWRPISLLTCISKIYETLISSRLDPHLLRLPSSFFGFFKGKSTESALIHRLSILQRPYPWVWCDLDHEKPLTASRVK